MTALAFKKTALLHIFLCKNTLKSIWYKNLLGSYGSKVVIVVK